MVVAAARNTLALIAKVINHLDRMGSRFYLARDGFNAEKLLQG